MQSLKDLHCSRPWWLVALLSIICFVSVWHVQCQCERVTHHVACTGELGSGVSKYFDYSSQTFMTKLCVSLGNKCNDYIKSPFM